MVGITACVMEIPAMFFSPVHTEIIAGVKFVGFGFYMAMILLWPMIQGLVWLSERYSKLVTGLQWWRSGLLTFISIIVVVVGWNFPLLWMDEGAVSTIPTMTSAMIFGTIATWIVCGRLYHFEFLHHLIVSIGVPILVFCAIAIGQVVFWKMAA